MNAELRKTLWSNSDRNRFFVLADDQKLPPGEFEIRTVTGRQQKVDITALEAFEISQEEAKTWLVAQFDQVMHKGKDALVGFFDRLRAQAQKPQTDQEKPKAAAASKEPKTETRQKQPGLSLRLFSALTGETTERLQTDPDAITRGTQRILSDLREFFEASTSPDTQQQQQARDMLHDFQTTLRDQGMNIDKGIDQLPDKLRELFSSSEQPEQLRKNAAMLHELANIIEQGAVDIVKEFRKQASEMYQMADRIDHNQRD